MTIRISCIRNVILFADTSDADIYNKHIDTLNRLAKLEDDMLRRRAAAMDKTTANLRKAPLFVPLAFIRSYASNPHASGGEWRLQKVGHG